MPARARWNPGLAEETKQRLRNAFEAGNASQKQTTTNGRFIMTAGGRKIALILPGGMTSAAGRFYYENLLDLPVPNTYAYE